MTLATIDPQTFLGRPRGRRIPGAPAMFAHAMLGQVARLGAWRGNRIFEDFSVKTHVAANGAGVIRVAVEGYNHFWTAGAAAPSDDPLFADPWVRTLPAGGRFLQLRGAGGDAAWFLVEGDAAERLDVPATMTPAVSADGTAILYHEFSPVFRTDHPAHTLWIGPVAAPRKLDLGGPVMGACFTPDGRDAFVLVRQPDGASLLLRIAVAGGDGATLARDLDTPPYWPGSVLFGATDDHVYLPAASTAAPDEILRQRPVAARQTKIYRMARSGGTLEPVVTSGSELSDPAVAGGALFWIKNITLKSVVALPAAGGDLREIMVGGYIPEWSPESDRIAFTVGQFRIADWAVCLDSYEVSVDAELRPLADPVAVVDGSHEDFTHVYSPCGRWIAYHSHRGGATIPFYDANEAHDAVFVRPADDYEAPEVEMSEDGWEIFSPRWSPDGRTLLYWSWDRAGHPGLYNVFLIDFDPDTGRKLGHRRLPMPDGLTNPTWVGYAPDGASLVVEDSFDIGRKALWVVAADGSAGRRLHEYRGHTYGGVAFTPDGATIVFSGLGEDDTMQLFAISATGGAVTQMTHDDHNILYPVVSPDGRWIAATRHMTTQELWRGALVG